MCLANSLDPDQTDSLTHCLVVDSSSVICWMNPFVILGLSGLVCGFYSIFDGKILTSHYVASDLGLHCLPMTLLGLSW